MNHKLSSKFALLILIVIISTLGCAGTSNIIGNSSIDNAKATSDVLSSWYADTYSIVSNTYNTSNNEVKIAMSKTINPIMNKLKRAIRVYIVSVQLAEKSNSSLNFADQLTSIATLIATVQMELTAFNIVVPEVVISK